MRAIRVRGFRIDIIDVDGNADALKKAVDGALDEIRLKDGGLMVCDREALPKDKPYNEIASLVCGTGIYGDALIIGAVDVGSCFYKYADVPQAFEVMLNLSK